MDRNFRLSKEAMPTRYDLRIDADLEAWRYEGRERITLNLKQPTRTLTLHAIDLEIVSAAAGDMSATTSVNTEAETVTFHFPEALPEGECELVVEFRGIILERLRGFYRSEKDGERYASTQFEAADARRAFPCFDEPEFKARFAITLVIPPGTMAVSNGAISNSHELENGRQEVAFTETPPISTYLVAFCIGPFEATAVAKTQSGVPVRVVVPQGLVDKGIYARDAHVRCLEYLENYTGIVYPYGKVDAIGIADFEAGAMENPGAITYRLTEIVADPERASTHSLKSIFYTAAHELTHMWWGDLVTMRWWNDLWLNESFATFVGYKVAADLQPQWGLWRDFVSTLAYPFGLDALMSTHPISFDVANAKQASERFDVITYWKGAGVVRMIENFLGADVFQAGVRGYLNAYRESNATADDFWRELDKASGRDVSALANTWIKEPGHPLVHAEAERTNGGILLKLRQQRFVSDPEARANVEGAFWPIPLVIKYGTQQGTEEKRILMEGEHLHLELPNAQWFFLNADASGFYRIVADKESQDHLVDVMQEVLASHERLYLIDNQWALLRAGMLSLDQYLGLLEGYRTETDRAVLSVITDQMAWLNTHVVGDEVRQQFESYVREFYHPHFVELGWEPLSDEGTDVRMKRATVLGALGGIARDQLIRAGARERLEKHFADPQSLDPNLVSTIVMLAARDGDHALYDRYLERKRNATTDPEEEERFLFALAAFEHPELIERALQLAMTDDVRSQDQPFFLGTLLARRHSRDAAWKFVRERWDDIAKVMDPMLLQRLVKSTGALTHEPVAAEVRQFLRSKVIDEIKETVAQVDERLRIDSVVVKRLAAELIQLLGRDVPKVD